MLDSGLQQGEIAREMLDLLFTVVLPFIGVSNLEIEKSEVWPVLQALTHNDFPSVFLMNSAVFFFSKIVLENMHTWVSRIFFKVTFLV